jgi:hypothetical protein
MDHINENDWRDVVTDAEQILDLARVIDPEDLDDEYEWAEVDR